MSETETVTGTDSTAYGANSRMVMVNGVEALPIVTSHSIDGTFGFCPRKFEFAHVYQQVPEAGSTGMAAEVGTAMHEAVQAWARIWLMPGVNRSDLDLQKQAVEAGLLTLLRWWPFLLETQALKEKRLAATQRSLDSSLHLLTVVVGHQFWNDYELATLPSGEAAIEIPWRVIHESKGLFIDPLGQPRVLVTQGKIDFVLRHRVTGEVRVFDLKTTNKQESMLDAAFRFSGQALGYSFILASALGHDPGTAGITVTYCVASFTEFTIQLKAYKIPAEEVLDYVETRNDLLDRMAGYLTKKWWPRRQHGCDSFMTPCPYLSPCQSRHAPTLGAWFEGEGAPFIERPRIYDTLWTFKG